MIFYKKDYPSEEVFIEKYVAGRLKECECFSQIKEALRDCSNIWWELDYLEEGEIGFEYINKDVERYIR